MATYTAFLPWIGGLVVIGTIVGIVKKMETRLVLFGSGLIMSVLALKPMAAFDAFQKSMTNAGLISVILSVMGFAFVMKLTGADQQLVTLVARPVRKVKFAVLPASMIVTWFLSIALPSASGLAAAVGTILIPLMMASGIHPAVAAAAIISANTGGNWMPGGTHQTMVAKMANADILEVTQIFGTIGSISGVIALITLPLVAYALKEHKGWKSDLAEKAEELKISYTLAIVPLIPLTLIVVGAQPFAKTWGLNVPASMIIGTIAALVISRWSPAEVVKTFFDGMGNAYANVMGIIIAAGVFTAGLAQVGLIKALLGSMTGVKSAVGISATLGPALIAILTGSGDASSIAFNEAVTPHAEAFGWTIQNLGALAATAAGLGRSISPMAAATIVAAGIAGVTPIEVVKRSALPMILSLVGAYVYVTMF